MGSMAMKSSSADMNNREAHDSQLRRRDIRRPGIISSYISSSAHYDGGGNGFLFALCAEPDMGRTSILTAVCKDADGYGSKSKYVDFGLGSRDRVAGRIVKACRDMTHCVDDYPATIVAFDNIPSLDEDDMLKASRALRKYVLSGGHAVISLAPEAEGILDELPGAVCYRSQDLLLVSSVQQASGCVGDSSTLSSMSHGIPTLVRATMLAQNEDPRGLLVDPRYVGALSDVAEHSLRPSLIREEREFRLAMIELGHGSVSDVCRAIGSVDDSIISSISRDAPFFGLDQASGTFECAGLTSPEALKGVIHRIAPIVARLPRVSRLVAELLVSCGDFTRAGIVVLACSPADRSSILLGHPAEFSDAGCRHMVEEAIAFAAESGDVGAIPEARLVLAALFGNKDDYGRIRQMRLDAGAGLPTRLLVMMRDALSGDAKTSLPDGVQPQAGLSRALAMALRGMSLLGDLRFADAYAYLLRAPERLSPCESLASCVLWGEYLLATGLSGNMPTSEELSGLDGASRFAAEAGAPFLSQLLSTTGPLVSVFAGSNESVAPIESCAQHSALLGVARLQRICLLAGAIADQRAGSGARAYVRLQQASVLATRACDGHFKAICHILLCATKSTFGEGVTADEVLSSRMPARLSMVARALAAVIESSKDARLEVMGKTQVSSCPSGTAWLVHVLANDYGDLSRRFRDVVPRPWIEEAERAAVVAGEFGERSDRSASALRATDPKPEGYQLDISLLGGFGVAVNGVPIDGSRLERRRAKSLLVLLAAMPGHSVKRYEAMESVWPELDFQDARQRVYEATSVLRTELTAKLGISGANPLVSNRGAGTIGLHPAHIHCDVDDFEELARSVLSTSRMRPNDVISCSARLERLYRGDLFVPQVDGAGMVGERQLEIRRLYADVMVFASGQALALGHAQTAVHYAQNACAADDLREDAELCLVKSLAATGRRLEAEVSYRRFTDRIVSKMQRPPSRELREAYREAVTGGEETSASSVGRAAEQAASA